MSEPTKHPPQTLRDAYNAGYDAACRDNKRKREQSYGYRVERAYLGADATTPPVCSEACKRGWGA